MPQSSGPWPLDCGRGSSTKHSKVDDMFLPADVITDSGLPSNNQAEIVRQDRSAGLSTDQRDAFAQAQNTEAGARLPQPVETTPLESDYFLTSRRQCMSRLRIRRSR